MKTKPLISIVSPVYNEEKGIAWFHDSLCKTLINISNCDFEVLYVNDGSSDNSFVELNKLDNRKNVTIRIIDFSRNFGKEPALSAGIQNAKGEAVLTLDSDGQHPVELIPEFIHEWQNGPEVVIGVRKSNHNEGIVKRYGSKIFYKLFNGITGGSLVPGSTDFRLIDRIVVNEFVKLNERNRMTRGLIDWLGFKRAYISFDANERKFGKAGYSVRKLFELAVNTFVSLSAVPLFLAGYIGLAFILLGLLVGLFVFIEQFILSDPLGLHITGAAMLGLLTVFLVGIILASQGLLGIYISRLLNESQGRPLFIIRKQTTIK